MHMCYCAYSSQCTSTMSKVLTWKVVLLGQVGVGKTSIFLRLRENRFVAGKISDGVDTAKLDFEVNGRPVKLELWDTAGHEKYRTLTEQYYRGAKACIYVYDVNNADTLHQIARYHKDALTLAENHLRFLVGNKIDLEKDKTLDLQTAQNFVATNCCSQQFEMSAKTGAGVKDAFQAIAEHLVKKFAPGYDSTTANKTEQLSPLDIVGAPSQPKAQSKCCE